MSWEGIFKPAAQPFVWLQDALFPKRCLGCRAWNEWCCSQCLAELTFKRQLSCPECNQISALGAFCEKCKIGRSLDGLWPAQPYGQPLIKKLIHDFKYDYLTDLGDILGQLLVTTMQTYQLPPAWHSQPRDKWQLVPIPLARRRLRERGFNQAAYLANVVAPTLGLTTVDILTRSHTTQPQSKISDPLKRQQNLKNVFKLKSSTTGHNQVYILVDDVYTSGTTMEECARVLKQAGAGEVWGLAVAKG